MNRRSYYIMAGVILVFVLVGTWRIISSRESSANKVFDGESALNFIEYQLSLGPRLAGSDAHARSVEFFQKELMKSGWEASVQESDFQGQTIRNVVAKRGSGTPWTIIGAHYDSRMIADQDPQPSLRDQPVPGANDGASGAAVLLELAASLIEDIQGQIWLVFFDAEDNGGIPGWDWILGSQAFVENLDGKPDAAIIVDMIGDSDLNIYYEGNSDRKLSQEIWETAAAAGYEEFFIPQSRHSMLDDHTPFLRAGIQAVDIIDFDYPYWHTTGDTLDKVSAQSLEAVGVTLQNWLVARHSQ